MLQLIILFIALYNACEFVTVTNCDNITHKSWKVCSKVGAFIYDTSEHCSIITNFDINYEVSYLCEECIRNNPLLKELKNTSNILRNTYILSADIICELSKITFNGIYYSRNHITYNLTSILRSIILI